MKKTAWLLALIIPAILVVAGFQVYWLADNYQREKKTLDIKTQTVFGDMVREMQDSSFQAKVRAVILDSSRGRARKTQQALNDARTYTKTEARLTRMAAAVGQELSEDSVRLNLSGTSGVIITFHKTLSGDSLPISLPPDSIHPDQIKRIVVTGARTPKEIAGTIDSLKNNARILLAARPDSPALPRRLNPARPRMKIGPVKVSYRDSSAKGTIRIDSIIYDTLPLDFIASRFTGKMDSMKANIPFSINLKKDSTFQTSLPAYELSLGNTTPYLLKRLSLPIVFSIGLITITLLSFILLYFGLKRQQRLAEIKQEFISNVTHELKTPIATVGVAIEALRNFNALNNPARTREYLDISRNELQRLSLLVDKVLKLSMFEKKEIELRPEPVNLKEIAEEVADSMRLQLEKQQASLSIETSGDCTITGDRLHLQSLVFNLVDNALKYGSQNPRIMISLHGTEQDLTFEVSDNGIGIPPEYRKKIFEKFFRVPHGDTHNAKGHGLGLSYVAEVVAKHKGSIHVEPIAAGGTRFIIHFPKQRV